MVGMPRGSSHEVCGSCSTSRWRSPLAACGRRSARSLPPGFTSPGPFRPWGFDPFDGLLLTPPARRISGGSAHGVPDPSELSPRPEPRRLSALVAFLPFACRTGPVGACTNTPRSARCARPNRPESAWLQGLAPRSESVALHAGVSARGLLAALLGFGPLQGVPSAASRPVLPPSILPRAFEPRSDRRAACAVRTIFRAAPAPRSLDEIGIGRASRRSRPSWGSPPHRHPRR